MPETLLIELLTEELPPKALQALGDAFAASLAQALDKAQLIDGALDYTAYASPRRLAVTVGHVNSQQASQNVLKKGPAAAHAMKDGAPTKALEGFARSCGVAVTELIVVHDGKQDVYAHEFLQTGQTLAALLEDMVQQAHKKLPIPKLMRWGVGAHAFVRPVHGLVALYGQAVVPIDVLGLTSGRATMGHRFLSEGVIEIDHAQDYAATLREAGKVIASFTERRDMIEAALNARARGLNATLAADEALLDEVAALVEWPVALEAGFEASFLAVPQECLILSMQQHQKYFPLLDSQGQLMNRFLLVSNLDSADPAPIIQGNERVLRARLSDAEFFYRQDEKTPLESRLSRLEQVVYHNKLGSQAQRVARLMRLSGMIAQLMQADVAAAEHAARLAKLDLVTEMVGEFPELQGVMGKYYALHDGEPALVADAIEQHYWPKFAGDRLPESDVARAVALADKLDTLVGIWGIGLVPTGDKDPYALRRAALGVLRMLMQTDLDGRELVQAAFDGFAPGMLHENTVDEVWAFLQARLAVWLNNDYSHDIVAAVLARAPARLDDIGARLQAVQAFKALPESAALAAANKRVQNLLKKSGGSAKIVDRALLREPQEKALYEAMQARAPVVQDALMRQDFQAALSALATMRPEVDAFFDAVMIMADDTALRNNRLALLHELSGLFNGVADIALLSEPA